MVQLAIQKLLAHFPKWKRKEKRNKPNVVMGTYGKC